MKKRIVSLLMAVLMTVSLLPTAAWAEVLEAEASQEPAAEEMVEPETEAPEETEAAPEETVPVEEETTSDARPYAVTDAPAVYSTTISGQCGDNLTWTLDSAGLLTISGTGAMWNYYYDDDDSSDCPWHEYRFAIKKVIIEDGVTSIGSCAFKFDINVESVSIPGSVTSIGYSAFFGCYELTDVTIPEGVTSIGGYAFCRCSLLESISLPASLEEVGNNALYAVNDWEEGTQYYGSNLTTVNYGGTEAQWNAIGGGNAGVPAGAKINFAAPVASGQCGDKLTWTLDDAGTLTISGTGAMKDYYYDESKTPWSDCPWHEYRSVVRKVIIKDGVTSIGSCAFTFNYYATSVTIPDSVTSIGDMAFYGCNGLTAVTIPEGVTHIGAAAFGRCGNIKTIRVPDSLEELENDAFNTVNEYYQEGDDGKWYAGHSLTDIYYEGSSMRWAVIGGNNAGVPEGVTIHYAIESDSISGQCGDNLTWTLDSAGLLTISGTGAMWDRWDASGAVKLPNWSGYTIKKIVIGEGVTSIGDSAFQGCSSLTEAVIPASVTFINSGAFAFGCDSLSTISYGGTMAQWKTGAGAAIGLGLNTKVVCSDGTITPTLNGSCGTSAHYSISSAGVLTISGTGAMADYNYGGDISDCPWHSVRYAIKEIVIEDGITHIGNCAFMYDTDVASVTIPNSVTSVGNWAFCGCHNLTEITLPEGVESIGAVAFGSCSALTAITIPGGVTSVGEGAFYDCSNLTTVNYGGTEAQWNAIGGGNAGVPESTTINFATPVADGTCGDNLTWALNSAGLLTISGTGAMWNRWDENYESELLPNWSGYTIKKIVIGEGVTIIGDGAFQNCSGLTEAVIASTVTEIGGDAFTNCKALEEVTISGANTFAISNAFYGCDSLSTISYGGTMAQWKDGAGAVVALPLCASVICTNGTITPTLNGSCGASARYSISSAGVLTISGTGAMADYNYDGDISGCPWHSVRYAIKEIVIKDGITHIGNCAFMYDTDVASVTIPNSVTSVGDWAFCGCFSLTEITLPEGVESIGAAAFGSCSALTAITIPGGVTSVGEGAFYDCSNLTTVNYGGTEAQWNAIGGGNAGVPESTTIHYAVEGGSIGGQCGDNLTWTLDSAGLLTISGTGAMWDRWDEDQEMPDWSNYTIKKIVIDEGVTSIGDTAFWDCSSLTEAVIASTVTEIGRLAFVDCTALKEVTISGANVSVIVNAFYGCDSLTAVHYGGTMAQWKNYSGAAVALPLCASVICTDGTIKPTLNGSCGASARYSISSAGVLTISGTGAMADYTYTEENASNCPWHSVRFAIKKIVIEDGITHIGNYAFKFDINVTSVTIPDSVTSIGREAFYGCDYLTEISIPGGVTSIGVKALDCTELATITFGDTEAQWRNIGGGSAGVPESTTITYSALDAALKKAGFSAPGTIFTDGGAEYDVSFPNYYNKADNPGGILPDVYFDRFKDVSIGELTLTLHEDTAEAWRDAYIQSAGWFGISDRVMCKIPYYAPAGATQYAAYIGTDVDAALAFATSGGQRYSNDGGYCPMGTPIAMVDTSNGRITNVDDYTTYYLVVWYNAAGAPIARHALRIHVESDDFNYALSIDDLLRGAGYAVPTESQFCIAIPDGLVEDTDYTFNYDQTTGHATVKLLPGDKAHWQQAFESQLEIVAAFEKPQSTATRLNVYFGDQDDSGVGRYIDGTYGNYYGWYTGDNLRPGSGRTFASVSEDADSNVTISVPQGSSWVRCIAAWADSSGNVLNKFMYTLSIEADSAFSYTWNVNEAEETVVASGQCGDNLTWTLDSAGLLTISGTGAMANYYYDADSSNCPWHAHRFAIKKVIIEDGVTSIGSCAFMSDTNLESVSIPGSVTSIGEWAFSGCGSLATITVPEGVTSIGELAFYGCRSMKTMCLPVSLTKVGNGALYTADEWQDEDETWHYDYSLTDIYYAGSWTQWNKITNIENAEVPWDVWVNYAVVETLCSGQCGDNLTWTLDSAGLLTISGTGAMKDYSYDDGDSSDCPWHEYRSAVRKIVIENGVTSIGSYAFKLDTNATSVTIPTSVTSIGNEAFCCCYELTSVTIPEGVSSIGEGAFYACSKLVSISLPASLKEVGNKALYAVNDWEDETQYYSKLTDIYYTSSKEQWESIENINNAGIPADVTVTYILRGVLSSGDGEEPSVLDMQNLYTYLTTDKIETGSLYAENEKAYQLAADVNGDGDIDVYDLQGLYETVANTPRQ